MLFTWINSKEINEKDLFTILMETKASRGIKIRDE
jgi:hypothetical protein